MQLGSDGVHRIPKVMENTLSMLGFGVEAVSRAGWPDNT